MGSGTSKIIYTTLDGNYFTANSDNSITLQPGTYMLISLVNYYGANDAVANFEFAGMTAIRNKSQGTDIKYKIETITSPTKYTHSGGTSTSYGTGSGICIKLN